MTVTADRRAVLAGLGALGVAACGPAPVAVPAQASTIDLDFADLERRFGGRLGFVMMRDGAPTGVWRAADRFVYCSTFKMYLAAATFMRVQAGEERLDRAVAITRADMIDHAPVTEPAIGRTLTVEQLMQGTVEVSDNPAANLLLKANGGIEAMRGFYRGIGDDSTTVDRFEPEMNRLDGDKDTIQPMQSVLNIRHLFLDATSPLSATHKAKLLGWMTTTPTGQGRLKAGTPAGWRVAHKTGTGGYGPTNDIGLLYPPTGAPIVVAAYYHAGRDSADAQNEAVIAEATRRALRALGQA